MARNPKEEECRRFAELYMFDAGFNATKAARMLCEELDKDITTIDSMYQYASEILNNEKTKKALEQIKQENAETFRISKEKIITKLNEMVDADSTTDKTKLDAIDKLIRMIGGYNDSLEMKGTQTLEVVIE